MGGSQGCGLSGLLYTIVAEPLSASMRRKLTGISVQSPRMGEGVTTKLLAYVDDITMVMVSSKDISGLIECLDLFQRAWINCNKSNALLVGTWPQNSPSAAPAANKKATSRVEEPFFPDLIQGASVCGEQPGSLYAVALIDCAGSCCGAASEHPWNLCGFFGDSLASIIGFCLVFQPLPLEEGAWGSLWAG